MAHSRREAEAEAQAYSAGSAEQERVQVAGDGVIERQFTKRFVHVLQLTQSRAFALMCGETRQTEIS